MHGTHWTDIPAEALATLRRPGDGNRDAAGPDEPRTRLSGSVADLYPHLGRPCRQIREHLNIVEPHRRGGRKLDPADDAVPGGAHGVRHAMAVRTIDRLLHAIVDADRQPLHARLHDSKVEVVRRDQGLVAADEAAFTGADLAGEPASRRRRDDVHAAMMSTSTSASLTSPRPSPERAKIPRY